MQNKLTTLAEGALGGLAGTMFMMQAQKLSAKLPDAAQPPSPTRDPADFMLSKAEEAAGRALPEKARGTAAGGLHFAYGMFAPSLLGLFGPSLGVRGFGRTLAAGAGLGAAVYAAGHLGWLPATGLTPPIRQHRVGGHATALVSHVLYGIVAALPLAILGPRRRQKPTHFFKWLFGA